MATIAQFTVHLRIRIKIKNMAMSITNISASMILDLLLFDVILNI